MIHWRSELLISSFHGSCVQLRLVNALLFSAIFINFEGYWPTSRKGGEGDEFLNFVMIPIGTFFPVERVLCRPCGQHGMRHTRHQLCILFDGNRTESFCCIIIKSSWMDLGQNGTCSSFPEPVPRCWIAPETVHRGPLVILRHVTLGSSCATGRHGYEARVRRQGSQALVWRRGFSGASDVRCSGASVTSGSSGK